MVPQHWVHMIEKGARCAIVMILVLLPTHLRSLVHGSYQQVGNILEDAFILILVLQKILSLAVKQCFFPV